MAKIGSEKWQEERDFEDRPKPSKTVKRLPRRRAGFQDILDLFLFSSPVFKILSDPYVTGGKWGKKEKEKRKKREEVEEEEGRRRRRKVTCWSMRSWVKRLAQAPSISFPSVRRRRRVTRKMKT